MRSITMTALALCAITAMGVTAANAAEASATTCMSMSEQVKTALSNNMQSPNYDAAVKEKGYGRDFCNNAMYKVGMDHYAQALKLLGQS